MNAIGAYAFVLSMEAAHEHQTTRPTHRRNEVDQAPRPSLRERVRKLFGSSPRIAREPGFAASRNWLDDVVPRLTSYPYPSTYR